MTGTCQSAAKIAGDKAQELVVQYCLLHHLELHEWN